ncbi:MAG: endonuclease MutS2 [candidate division Zixibacteria bacterium]|nr:endonuclease MutS2 [candidate division Zixibacteria bacterium]
MFDSHTLEVLEFPKVKSLISKRCLTPYGRVIVEGFAPLSDSEEIKRLGTEISQMKDIVNFGEAFPLFRIEDCRDLLRTSQTEGVFLDPEDIIRILDLVEISIDIHEYDYERRENFPSIAIYLEKVRAFPELKKEIRRSIDEDGQICDNASSKLKQTRLDLINSRRRITAHLQNLQVSQSKQAGLQDDVVTMRNGRYVISVPSNRYQNNLGILHDRSQTGATFYVEPQDTIELNNHINELGQEERIEMDRILRAITADIAKRSEALLENTQLIGHLDAIYACAQFSKRIQGNQPSIGERASFNLLDVRHPLLMVQAKEDKDVIPNSLSLNDTRQAILITGPNTGGKTIILKTIGLAIVMAQSGLHIAADEKSSVGLFLNILADIGDEQSIEQSLSTFSSHISNIICGVNQASKDTLLLFDEIGAGTDPKEGSALAEVIMLYSINKGARLLATTHYSQLKTMAMEHSELENASLEFDRKTLIPTYSLRLGIPGSSYAVEIAQRLGLPPEICKRASKLVGSAERSLSNLIASLEEELATVKKDQVDLSERLAKVTELEQFYKIRSKKLKDDIEGEKKRALEETEQFLNETRSETEKLVADIRSSQADKKKVKEFHHKVRSRQQQVKKSREKLLDKPSQPDKFEVGDAVEILSLNQRGEIERIIGNRKAQVKVGNILTTVEIRNLRKLEKTNGISEPSISARVLVDNNISPEIHLRGMTGEEACETLDKFLDRAIMAGLSQIYVIHGKGTGALRRILTSFLKERSEVASIRLGNWNEGGSGVTIVKLKE